MSVGANGLLHGSEDPLSVATTDGVAGDIEAKSPLRLFWRRLRRDRVAMIALGFIVFLIVVAIGARLVTTLAGTPGPNVQNAKALDQFGTPTGPSAAHPMGVDTLGRDVFSRVLYGARVSLEVALIATALSMVLGVAVGLIAGFYRGWVDALLSRLIDVVLAFPILLLALGVAAACSLGDGCFEGLIEPGLGVVIFVIAFVVVDKLTPGDLWHDILREKNVAAAITMAGISIGLSIIIAAAIH